jgi:hypothetical protein
MDQTQGKRKKVDIMKEEINAEDIVILEVLEEIKNITHLLTQQGNFMHLKTPSVV